MNKHCTTKILSLVGKKKVWPVCYFNFLAIKINKWFFILKLQCSKNLMIRINPYISTDYENIKKYFYKKAQLIWFEQDIFKLKHIAG